MKKGLATSELWMTTIPGLAILAHGATMSTHWQVSAVCYAMLGFLCISWNHERTKAKNGGAK